MSQDYLSNSAHEQAAARAARRLPESILKPVTVKTVEDIKSVLRQLDPKAPFAQDKIPLTASMMAEGDEERQHLYRVSAHSSSKSKRTMLLEGFDVIKRHMELHAKSAAVAPIKVNGVDMYPAVAMTADKFSNIDPIVKQWTGGVRKGLTIVWSLDDGHDYKYDIYEHSLSRTKRDAS